MRPVTGFLAAIFGTLLLAALLAWPAWLLAHALVPEWPFHRVVSRFWQFLLLIGTVLAVRRLGLRSLADWGYGLPRGRFLRHAGSGLAIGVATMLPMTLAMLAMGILSVRTGLDASILLQALLNGLLAGFGVAIVEETYFRGLMYRAVSRESGFTAAAWSTALVYSAIHFLTRAKIPANEVDWGSGLKLLGDALAHFSDPLPIADSFVTLVLVGLMLAFVRRRTDAIAACIGLHMGWVTVIKVTTAVTRVNEDAAGSFLVGNFDGYTGWLVAGWASLLIAIAWSRGWLTASPAAAR